LGYEANDTELGYRLKQAFWKKGYATEGSRSLIIKGFTQLGVQRVASTALAANIASTRVMEKAGLKFQKRFLYQPMNQDAVLYALNQD
jgi:RimJ/RimL family protein N-acetyltransferase